MDMETDINRKMRPEEPEAAGNQGQETRSGAVTGREPAAGPDAVTGREPETRAGAVTGSDPAAGPKAASGHAFRPGTRKLVQLYAALLYNANLKGFIDGHIYSGPLKSACVPGFNCYSCPGAIASCPLGSLQNALNAAGHTAPWYMLGILALFGVVLGRTICGWLCPLGLIQELLHKVPVPKLKKSIATRWLSYLKYVFLAVFVIAIPVWYGLNKGIPVPGFCKYICPAGTLEGAVGLLQNKVNETSFYQLGILFTRKWVIMLIIGLACVFIYRSFCRFICPLGAIYGFFNRFSITGVKVNADRCNGCGLCVRKCQMDVLHVGDHECISCGKCIDVCAQGAISLKAGKITLAGPAIGKNADPAPVIMKRRKIGRIVWCAAIAVLVFALIYFNRSDPNSPEKASAADVTASEAASGTDVTASGTASAAVVAASEAASGTDVTASGTASAADAAASGTASTSGTAADEAVPAAGEAVPAVGEAIPAADEAASAGKAAAAAGTVGTAEGDILPDFETDLLSGETFRLSDKRGQVVIINLWAITCAPCIEELPSYEKLKVEHPEVEILAIHHRAGAKKAPDFLSDKGWDHLDFALDSKEKGIYTLLDASDALPQTIVLNKDGVIIYNVQAPLTYEQLEALLKKAEQSS